MKTATITVTQPDIDQGEPGTCGNCPVALAAQRDLRTPSVGVTLVDIKYIDPTDGRDYIGSLPRMARDWIRRFDEGRRRHEMQPFSFDIDFEEDV